MPTSHFFANVGGLNPTDSPFYVKDNQAIDGYNYNYTRTGAIQKRNGLSRITSSPDSQTNCLGLSVYDDTLGNKTLVRVAGTKWQTLDGDTGITANLSSDTSTPTSDFLPGTSAIPVTFAEFVNGTATVLWGVGGGMSALYGYTGTKITQNGVPEPTGTPSTSVTPHGGHTGGWASADTYYYTLALRKASTQATGNAALDVSAVVANTDDKVTLTFPVGVDTTLYDQWYIYRSAPHGVAGFTAGVLVAQVPTTQATFDDTGDIAVDTSSVVPREGNTTDNSRLDAATYNAIAVFKRRLVVATGSTIVLSDVNKSESFPSINTITIPTGGPITALGVVGFNTPTTSSSDEVLLIWKDNELWQLTGNDEQDWVLKFVDVTGCAGAALVARAKGYVYWMNYNGIYMWNGAGKPFKISRPIEAFFEQDGVLDKSSIQNGWATYFQKANQVIFQVSHRIYGTQKFAIKLDLRLTMPMANYTLAGNELDGVFSDEFTTTALTSGLAYLPASKEEIALVADSSGNVYKHYFAANDDSGGIRFSYTTKNFDFGNPSIAKRFKKVIVWVDNVVNADLTLDYWSSYKGSDVQKSTISRSMLGSDSSMSALWDVAYWDQADWDVFTPNLLPITFNLSSAENNAEGDGLRLRFKQEDADVSLTIHGFTVIWEEIGLRH